MYFIISTGWEFWNQVTETFLNIIYFGEQFSTRYNIKIYELQAHHQTIANEKTARFLSRTHNPLALWGSFAKSPQNNLIWEN